MIVHTRKVRAYLEGRDVDKFESIRAHAESLNPYSDELSDSAIVRMCVRTYPLNERVKQK